MLYGLEFVETAHKVVKESQGKKINCPDDVCDIMYPIFKGQNQEQLWCLLLNTKHGLIGLNLITIGLIDRTFAHPREIFRRAIIENASRIMIVHNHPSGDTEASSQDIELYDRLIKAGKIIGIDMLDHIIIANSEIRKYYSLREHRQNL
jgi:DNA repair protein RadC